MYGCGGNQDSELRKLCKIFENLPNIKYIPKIDRSAVCIAVSVRVQFQITIYLYIHLDSNKKLLLLCQFASIKQSKGL